MMMMPGYFSAPNFTLCMHELYMLGYREEACVFQPASHSRPNSMYDVSVYVTARLSDGCFPKAIGRSGRNSLACHSFLLEANR